MMKDKNKENRVPIQLLEASVTRDGGSRTGLAARKRATEIGDGAGTSAEDRSLEATQDELASQLSRLSESQVDMVLHLADCLLRRGPEEEFLLSRSGFRSFCIASGAVVDDAQDMDAKLATLPDWVVRSRCKDNYPSITIKRPKSVIALLAEK